MSYTEEGQLHAAGKGADFSGFDLVFRWNETIAALGDREATVPPERSIVAGVPRFDFYRPPFNALLASKRDFCASYGLDAGRPLISWSTNFWFTFFHDNPHHMEPAITGLKEGNSPHWRDFPQRVAREVEGRQQLSATVFRIAREFTDAQVVIKIHPAEERRWYDEKVREHGLRNVRVIHREYIWNVLNPADLHLHTSCTTGFEAWLLGKPTIDMQFPRRDWFHAPQMFDGGHVAESEDECLEQVRYYLEGGSLPAEYAAARPRIIEWFAGPIDGRSGQRCADAMDEWVRRSERVAQAPPFALEDIRYRALSQVKSLIGLEPYESLAKWVRREPQDPLGRCFTPQDLAQWVSGIRRVLVNGPLTQAPGPDPSRDLVPELR